MIDKSHPLWFSLKKGIAARIEDLRDQLEGNHPAESTALIRGRIYELRRLVEEVESPPKGTTRRDSRA